MIKRVLLFSLFLALVATFNVPVTYADGMQDDIDRAVTIIQAFRDIPEKSIPPEVLRNAKGVAIMTVIKAGFMVSGRGGSGVVVARTGKGWSGPSAIGTGGAGFGFQIGAEQTDFIFVLNTHGAVEAFSQGGNVQFGGNMSVAAGPVGRTAEADVTPVAAVYAYSRSKGLFAGMSLEGTVIATRNETNAEYYGRSVTPWQILSGKVKVPAGARKLQKALARY
jgi:lipid-binding SYLF domain-containing protein